MNKLSLSLVFSFMGINAFVLSQSGRPIGGSNVNVHDFCISNSGKYLFSTECNRVNVFELPSGNHLETIQCFDSSNIFSLALSADSTFLVAGTSSGNLYFYSLTDRSHQLVTQLSTLITSITILDPLKIIAVGTGSGEVKIISLEGILLKEFKPHIFVTKVAYSNNGEYLASSGMEGKVMLYNLKDNYSSFELLDKRQPCRSIAFSPNGSFFLVSFDNGKILRWKVKPQNMFQNIDDVFNFGWITSVCFYNDNVTWAYSNLKGKVRIQTPFLNYKASLKYSPTQIKFTSIQSPKLCLVASVYKMGLYYISPDDFE